LAQLAPHLRAEMAQVKKQQAEAFLAREDLAGEERARAMRIMADCDAIIRGWRRQAGGAGAGTARARLEGYQV